MKIFKNANLYGEVILDFLVAGKVIQDIGESLEIKYPNIEVEDLNRKIVVPSLIDQHVHTIGGGGEGGPTTRCPELSIKDIVKSGVSTIVGVLGTDSYTRSIENLVAKTKAIKEHGFHSYCLTGSYRYPSINLTGSVEKDLVFIDEVIGVKLAYNDHRCSHPSYDEIVRLASEVRLGGLVGNKPGFIHIHTGSGKHGLRVFKEIVEKENLPISVFRPTHLDSRDPEVIDFGTRGGYVDITTHEDYIKTGENLDFALKNIPIANITMSSDSNGSMPIWNDHKEMIGMGIGKMSNLYEAVKTLVWDFGYTLRTALKPCTVNVARALDLETGTGDILVGSPSDFLVLDQNFDIQSFYLGDKWILKDGEVLLKINFEE